MENYEQKYKEALEKARVIINEIINEQTTIANVIASLENVIPGLKESEDEKIRKGLINYFNDFTLPTFGGLDPKKILAWLEKQGEQKPVNDLSPQEAMDIAVAKCFEQGEQKPNYCHHEVDLSDCSEEYRKAYYDGWNNCNQQHAQLKAEQKPAWSEEDERIYKVIVELLNSWSNGTIGGCIIPPNTDRYINWLKSIKDRVLPQPKQEWSEDDKNRINRLIAYFEDKESFTAEDDVIYANWLKSLKGKVRPQTNQEWSEEDERIYKVVLELIDSYSKGTIGGCIIPPNVERYAKWLKSIKNRYTWKPSDEQMERLKGTINSLPHQEVLYSLYQDLKKLMEE